MSWGAVIGAGVSLVGGAVANKSAKDSAAKTNRANQAMADAENEYNYKMFREGRGSEGSAVLPLYGVSAPTTEQIFAQFPELAAQYNASKTATKTVKDASGRKIQVPKDTRTAEQWLEDYKVQNPTSPLVKQVDAWVAQNTTNAEKDLFDRLLANYQTGYDVFGDPTSQAQAAQADYGRLAEFLPMTEDTIRSVLDGSVANDRAAAQGAIEAARTSGIDGVAGAREGLGRERTGVADMWAQDQLSTAEQLGQARSNAADSVSGALMSRANARREAIDLAEQEAVNRLATARERGGFGGTSTGYINGIARALLSSRDAAALATGDARVQGAQLAGDAGVANAGDRRAAILEGTRATGQARLDNAGDLITTANERAAAGEQGALERSALIDKDLQTRVAFQDAPLTLLNNAISMRRLPQSSLYDQESALMDSLNFFRLGEGRASNAVNQPDAVVAPGSGAAIGQTLAGVGGAVAADSIKNGKDSWWSSLFNKKKEG